MKHKYVVLIILFGIILIIGGLILTMTNKKTNIKEKIEEMNKTEEAVFAGGCFWCMEYDFEKLEGVAEVISGYSGGEGNPSYEDYSEKGHVEVVKVIYNPDKISYEELLEHFWTHIDPTDSGGQFCDRGKQYRSAIFYNNSDEKKKAEESKRKVSQILKQEVSTEIIKLEKFYKAEEYHQEYYEKNPVRYKFYRFSCGRNNRVNEIWEGKNFSLTLDEKYLNYKKPEDEQLRKQLTEIQYKVTQKEGTEKPFDNEYDKNEEEGIYVDILSGEPLFSSTDKFDSGTGWPSFTKPIDERYIVEKSDYKLILKRTEVRSKYADNHIGHVFNDGPSSEDHPTGTGKRYCMNSAALNFIPKQEMKEKGYEDYLHLFE
jgi:peptide methionine sulfoxide reductase msrA/msrB